VKRYLTQRVSLSLFTIWVVATVLFFFVHLLPGDPAQAILGGGQDFQPSPEQVAVIRQKLGLDRPLHEQYLTYLGGIVQGDLGVSFLTGRPVALDLRLRFGRTLMLVIPSITLSAVIGISVGLLAARFRGSWIDGLLSSVGLVGHSLPSFVIGSLLVLLLSIWLGLLPSSGFVEFERDPRRFLSYISLPVTTLVLGRMASTMRMTRMSMVEQLMLDYVRTARAKGLSERHVLFRHVLRNAVLPVVTVIGLQTGRMFAGAMVVEALFNWPGLNSLLIKAVENRDYPLILGSVLLTSIILVLANLATDLSYGFLDPRIRYE
jgi:peptide/nickel transport system permease protein